MARLFVREVFNQTVSSGLSFATAPEYHSGSDFYDLLGCADEIVLQTIVLSTSSAVSVMAQFQTTNDGGRHWTDVTGLNPTASPTSTSDLPKSALVKATGALASPFAKQGRVKVVASGAATVTGIKVKVIACGRSR